MLFFKGSPAIISHLDTQKKDGIAELKLNGGSLKHLVPIYLCMGKRRLCTFNLCKSTRTISYVHALRSF